METATAGLRDGGRLKDIDAFIHGLYGLDLHTKRVESLAAAPLGVIVDTSCAESERGGKNGWQDRGYLERRENHVGAWRAIHKRDDLLVAEAAWHSNSQDKWRGSESIVLA